MKIISNYCFWTFHEKSTIQNLPLTELFDRRYTFPFCINNMSYLNRNILSKKFYASIRTETLCIFATAADLIYVVKGVDLLLNAPVSFLYWKRSSGKALKYFISLQILRMNLLSSFLSLTCLHVYVYF